MNNTFIDFLNFIWAKFYEIGVWLIGLIKNMIVSLPYALNWLKDNQLDVGQIYCHAVRWLMPVLALLILVSVIRSLIRVRNPQERWGYLIHPELGEFPITHWETLIGRSRSCDITMNFAKISRVHCALIFDGKKKWRVHNLAENESFLINGKSAPAGGEIDTGDRITFGGTTFEFEMISNEENVLREKIRKKASSYATSPVFSMVILTIFQALTVSSLIINRAEHTVIIATSFALFAIVMWVYVLGNLVIGKKGFEPEILAFFLCSLCLAVTASSNPAGIYKQLIAIILGMVAFLALSWYLRDLKRVVRIRYTVAGLTVLLLAASLLLGTITNGASNWIYIGGVSLQPSEIAKVCFIFAGSASLERLFNKKNLFAFIIMSFLCFGILALMSDLGTAAIFFVTFLVIAYLRSGDYATLALIIGGALGALLMVMKLKPYIAARFSVWGHAWDNAAGAGYQQVRTMSAAASGGLIGVGSGEGWLHNVAAANTDLVFGMICEEWGLIIALLAVLSIASLSFFIVRVVKQGRSSYYVISACAAASLLVFQTMLNVFGSVDLFPLTGVTFPFVSCGGSSMLAAWGLLAFIKAADTRQGASFAVRKVKLRSMWQAPVGPVGVEADYDPENDFVDGDEDDEYHRERYANDGCEDYFNIKGRSGKYDASTEKANIDRDRQIKNRSGYSTTSHTISIDDVTGLLNKKNSKK